MTAIHVVLPSVVGQVTAIDGNTITVTQPGGTTATIHVDGSTTYKVNGAAGALSDVKVGSFIAAEGTQRTDGSLDAAAVRTGDRGVKGPGFPGGPPRRPGPERQPGAIEQRQLGSFRASLTRGAALGVAPLSILTSFSATGREMDENAAPRDLQHDRSFRCSRTTATSRRSR